MTDSPSRPQESPRPKRTRASKPKVRTGCITWIRRIKCDEERPSCLRCTSTGRTCDGYGVLPGSQSRPSTQGSSRAAPPELSASHDPSRTPSRSTSGRFAAAAAAAAQQPRTVPGESSSVDVEGYFFHRFLVVGADSIAARGIRFPPSMMAFFCVFGVALQVEHRRLSPYEILHSFRNFWASVAPRTSTGSEAVRHAIIAISAARELYDRQTPPEAGPLPDEELEVFIIQQYNKAIALLSRNASPSSAENVRATMVCCLIFICLECLRQNSEGAVTHLINGLKILQSLPPRALQFLEETATPPPSSEAYAPLFDREGAARLVGPMEIAACFAVGIRLVLSEIDYRYQHPQHVPRDQTQHHPSSSHGAVPWTNGTEPMPYPPSLLPPAVIATTTTMTTMMPDDLPAAHRSVCALGHDVAARLYVTGAAATVTATTAAHEADFWADQCEAQRQEQLRSRVRQVQAGIEALVAQNAVPEVSFERFYAEIDRAHLAYIKEVVARIDYAARRNGALPAQWEADGAGAGDPSQNPNPNPSAVEIMRLVDSIQRAPLGRGPGGREGPPAFST